MRFTHTLLAALLVLAGATALTTQAAGQDEDTQMTQHVRGDFDVKMIPTETAEGEPASIGRMLIDKQYHGPLEGTGKGQFLGVRSSSVEGSAGYVAMELVEGTLDGKSGSFVLQHSGSMNRGELSLDLDVVPDSGTGELTGLAGSMRIVIDADGHHYEFDYSLGE